MIPGLVLPAPHPLQVPEGRSCKEEERDHDRCCREQGRNICRQADEGHLDLRRFTLGRAEGKAVPRKPGNKDMGSRRQLHGGLELAVCIRRCLGYEGAVSDNMHRSVSGPVRRH